MPALEIEVDDIAGIRKEDGTVKCRDCMDEEDWKGLALANVITKKIVEEGEEWIYCDYCEKRL
jgi:hypothetical protein